MYPNLELAKRIGISESSMHNKLKGRNEFLLSEIEKILDIFPEVNWRVLFARADEQGKAG